MGHPTAGALRESGRRRATLPTERDGSRHREGKHDAGTGRCRYRRVDRGRQRWAGRRRRLPADVPCWNFSSSLGQCVNSRLAVGGTSYSVDWYLPNGTASGLMLLEHGFFRSCGNLRGTSKAVMEKGVMVMCVNADMTGGNPALGSALGDLLASRALAPPAGNGLPERYIVGGHSGGRPLRRRRRRPPRRARLPVARRARCCSTRSRPAASPPTSRRSPPEGSRPVLAVASEPAFANLFNNSFGALKDLPNTFVGVQLSGAASSSAFRTGQLPHRRRGRELRRARQHRDRCTPTGGEHLAPAGAVVDLGERHRDGHAHRFVLVHRLPHQEHLREQGGRARRRAAAGRWP